MIYDGFTFFNEFDILEIRLGILYPIVSKFILVESDHSFTGNPKPLYFLENKERFTPFLDKIVHIIHKSQRHANPWDNETDQRNAIKDGMLAKDRDVVMISDVDEIPDPKVIVEFVRKRPRIQRTGQKLYYYYLNCKKSDLWNGTVITSGQEFKATTPQKLRDHRCNSGFPLVIGGWHYSYMGGLSMIQTKLESFSEIQDNRFKTSIDKNIETCIDHLTGKPLEIENSFPEFVVKNKDKYKHLIKGT